MSQSDRISTRPMCFGAFDRDQRADRGCISCKSLRDCIPPKEELALAGNTSNAPTTRSKYHREIKPGVFVDVYDVLQAFDVRNSALQHLVKKALAAGQRGHKDRATDMAEIVQSAIRAQELEQ